MKHLYNLMYKDIKLATKVLIFISISIMTGSFISSVIYFPDYIMWITGTTIVVVVSFVTWLIEDYLKYINKKIDEE